MRRKKIYLIGAGPGKSDLITLRGKRILEEAEVVLYDYLVDKSLLSFAPDHAEMICCGRLAHKGRYSYGHPVEQQVIEKLMLDKVEEGKKVVRLKNGDPAFFSRFSEELRFLAKERLEFEVVPGVTAAGAASSIYGIPLTDRNLSSNCLLAPGHEKSGSKPSKKKWHFVSKAGTLVIYMGVGGLDRTVKRLLAAGRAPDTPVIIIQDISLISQRQVRAPLSEIPAVAKESGLAPPAIIIIGEVAGRGEELNWTGSNRRILFTGLSKERYFLRGNYEYVPMIEIIPTDDYTELDGCIDKVQQFHWLVFTSRYGVKYFFERIKEKGRDSRILADLKIAVIGRSTGRQLEKYNLRSDLMPRTESSKGLAETFKGMHLTGKSMLMPRSDISDKGLEAIFKEMGAQVMAPVAYKNVMPKELPDLDPGRFDEIMLTSPSTVRNFKKRYGKVPVNTKIKSIGEVTAKEVKKCHLRI